jgi:hypothetical protein
MPDVSEIEAEKLRIYESEALRSDINDDEANVLLKWGEEQIVKLSESAGDAFEEQSRFLRQLIKNINRFVGQRQFNDAAGQTDYMEKVVMWLPKVGFPARTAGELMAVLPPEPENMAGTLRAILDTLTPIPPQPDTDSEVLSGFEY